MFHILINCFTKKYFQFKGRANRKEYIVFIIFFLFLFEFLRLLTSKDYSNLNKNSIVFSEIELSVYVLLFFAMFLAIPSLSLTIRRLHDFNFNGWWILFISLLKILGFIFFERYMFIFQYIIDIPLFILRGTNGINRYGEQQN